MDRPYWEEDELGRMVLRHAIVIRHPHAKPRQGVIPGFERVAWYARLKMEANETHPMPYKV